MTRQDYRNPPIHEVVLDLQFADGLEEDTLEVLGQELSVDLGTPARASTFSFQAGLGSAGPSFHGGADFAGWDFSKDPPNWLLRVYKQQLTLHSVRRKKWPGGDYVGWEGILEEYVGYLGRVQEHYGGLTIRRAGLRYINRIAVPIGSTLEEWFTIAPESPDNVKNLHSFHMQQVWSEIEGHEHLAGKLVLALIEVPEEVAKEDCAGIVLDIDVFNMWVSQAPAFGDLLGWFSEAHDVENDLFESSITPELRTHFL